MEDASTWGMREESGRSTYDTNAGRSSSTYANSNSSVEDLATSHSLYTPICPSNVNRVYFLLMVTQILVRRVGVHTGHAGTADKAFQLHSPSRAFSVASFMSVLP